MTTVDTLIAGQGLAGSLLAWHLVECGASVLVVDSPLPGAPGAAAAGVLNPITGPRLVMGREVPEMLATAAHTYGAIERATGVALYRQMPLRRLVAGDDELARWRRRQDDAFYRPWLGELSPAGSHQPPLADNHGSFLIHGAGIVDTAQLLNSLRSWLIAGDRLRHATLDAADVSVGAGNIRWQDIRARHLVFCEGYRVTRNPWFNWLPITPSRGESMIVHLPGAPESEVIHRRQTLVPLGGGRFRLGATWGRGQTSPVPTTAGRQQLLDGLSRLLHPVPPARVLAHHAGVRPGCRHGPLYGLHPDEPGLAVMSGMASRGALYAPLISRRLAHGLLTHPDTLPELESWRSSTRLARHS